MADGKVQIIVDVVAGSGAAAKAKKPVEDLEREVIESQKRISQAGRKTDEAILKSQTARIKAEKTANKAGVDEFIKSLHTKESAAKESARRLQSTFKDVFAGTFLGMGAYSALTAGASKAFSGIQTAFQKSLDFSQMRTSLAQFEGGIAAAETRIRKLMKVAQDTPGLSFSSAVEGQKRLMGIGFAGDEATKILTGLAKVRVLSGSTKEDFDAMIVNLTQIATGGQMVTQEIREMATRMPAIVGIIRKEFGGIGEELNDIDPKQFVSRLANAMSKVQADANQTGLAVENFSDAWDRLYISIGSVIEQNPEFIAAIVSLTKELDGNTNALASNESQTRSTFSSWVSWTARAAIATANFTDEAGADLKALVNALAAAVTGLSSLAIGAVSIIPKAINEYLIKPFNAAIALIQGVTMTLPTQFGGGLFSGIGQIPTIDTSATDNLSSSLAGQTKRIWAGVNNSDAKQRSANRWQAYESELQSINTARANRPATGSTYDWLGVKPNQTTGGSTLNAGGGSGSKQRSMPKTKSSKVNLNLKDDMSDALDIAARFGLVVTSGKDGKHNEGSAHLTGGAFDIRTTGVSPNVIGAAMQAFREAGYNVKDERVRPPGQKEWSAPHFHVSGAGRRKGAGRADREIASYISDFPGMLGGSYGKGTARFGSPIELDAAGNIVSYGDLGKGRGERAEISRDIDLSKMEKQLAIGEQQVEVYKDLYRALAELNDMSKEEEFWLDVKLGKYKEFTDEQLKEIANTYALIDAKEKQREVDAENQRALEDYQREQQRIFEDTRQGWEDLLNDLANGNFKSIWDRFRQQMLDAFIKPASAYLAQLFGGMGMPGGQQGGSGGLGGIFSGIFGGGSIGPMNAGGMGPGGTPMFNPSAGGGGFGGILGNLFGGGQGGGGLNLGGMFRPRGGGSGSTYIPGIGGGITIPGGMGSGGFGGFLRGIGGGSMMGGVAGLGAMGASIAGGAIGGKWGNMLSLAGTGAMIGLQFGGPWGAAIGGAIGAGAGLIAMLFGGDKTAKRIKEAALSTYGITIKDKSVLKSLVQLGKSMFGKRAAENAQAVVSSDEGQLILRNYAEATNQSSEKIDKLYIGDENWKGNQFTSKFGGFRAFGGPVSAGKSYVVGERGPEVFKPSTSGTIVPSAAFGDPSMMMQIFGQLEETINALATRLQSMRPGDILSIGANENPEAITDAWDKVGSRDLRFGERSLKLQGAY